MFHTPAQSFRTRHGEREKHTLQQTSQLVPQLLVPNSFLKKKKKKKKKKRPKTSTGQTDYRAAEIATNQKNWSQRVRQSSLDVFLLTCTNQLQTGRKLVLLKRSSKQDQKQLWDWMKNMTGWNLLQESELLASEMLFVFCFFIALRLDETNDMDEIFFRERASCRASSKCSKKALSLLSLSSSFVFLASLLWFFPSSGEEKSVLAFLFSFFEAVELGAIFSWFLTPTKVEFRGGSWGFFNGSSGISATWQSCLACVQSIHVSAKRKETGVLGL